jgi:hypothetical protein
MGKRAEALARDIKRDTLTGIARALADEAVLTVERLEHLDATLQGDPAAWLGIVSRMPPTVAEIVVNAPLAEVRQQAMALKALLAELSKVIDVAGGVPKVDVVDEMARARAARLASQG